MVSFYSEIHRPVLPQFTKIIGPLILISLLGLLSLAIPINELEVRAAFGFTALLSIVAYQFATSGSAPDTSYLSVIDKIFLLGYVFLGIALIVIWYATQIPEEKAGVFSKLMFKILFPSFITITSFTLLTKYQEAAEDFSPANVEQVVMEESIDTDSLYIPVFTPPNLNQFKSLWNPDIQQSRGAYDLNYICPNYPSFKLNTIRILNNGTQEVFWQLYDNISWSNGEPIGAKDIAFGFKIEPDSLLQKVEVLRSDLIKLTYKRRLFQPQQRKIPIYPHHYFSGIYSRFGADSVVKFRASIPSPGYGPYRIIAIGNERLEFQKNPYFPNNSCQFSKLIIEQRQFDTNAIAKGTIGDYLLKGSISPDVFNHLITQPPPTITIAAEESLFTGTIVQSYNSANTEESILANLISKSFKRTQMVMAFYQNPDLAKPAYWPLSRLSGLFDSTCTHCDEFEAHEIKNQLLKNGFTFNEGKLYYPSGKKVEINLCHLSFANLTQTKGALLFKSLLENLGITINLTPIEQGKDKFLMVCKSDKFSLFLETAMNEPTLMDWLDHLVIKDKLLNNLHVRYEAEIIPQLRNKLGKRMVNYGTTIAHYFIPIVEQKTRNYYKTNFSDYFILPGIPLKDFSHYSGE